MTLPIKMIIESVIHRMNENGVGIYVTHSGDTDRGTLYVKTIASTGFKIHSRCYDFSTDSYTWESNFHSNEQSADNSLAHFASQDRDCWTIDIEQSENPFKDLF